MMHFGRCSSHWGWQRQERQAVSGVVVDLTHLCLAFREFVTDLDMAALALEAPCPRLLVASPEHGEWPSWQFQADEVVANSVLIDAL